MHPGYFVRPWRRGLEVVTKNCMKLWPVINDCAKRIRHLALGFCHLTFFTRFSEICDYLDVKRKLTPHFRRQSVTRRDTNEVPPGGEEKLFDRQILKLYKSCKGAEIA
jgi:hypothetical protein